MYQWLLLPCRIYHTSLRSGFVAIPIGIWECLVRADPAYVLPFFTYACQPATGEVGDTVTKPALYLPPLLKARGVVGQTVLCSGFHPPGQNQGVFFFKEDILASQPTEMCLNNPPFCCLQSGLSWWKNGKQRERLGWQGEKRKGGGIW